MRVIQILPKIKAGGVERGVLDLARYFKDNQKYPYFETIVVSSGGDLTYLLKQQGLKHYQISVDKKSPFSLFQIKKIKRIIQRENPDIIHARSRVPAWISFFASRNTDSHFITTAHGIYKNRISSEVMGWGKFVVCPSGVVAQHMKKKYGVPEEKIVIIHRWVDLDKFKFKDSQAHLKSNSIVSVGRISPSKGYEHLIKAFRKVVRFNPYLKLKIVGSADKSKEGYLNQLKTLVTRFSLNYNVEFLGFRQDVEEVLSKARVLVVPSLIKEAFGRVVIEAASCGAPVIATKVGGLQEIIESGKDGLLVPPADSEALADAILKVVDSPSLAADISEAARKKVERFYTMENSLNRLEKVYQRAHKEERILVTKISSFGDIILIIPSLARLRQKFPNAKIYLLTSKRYVALFYDCPYIDKVITVPDGYKKLKEVFKVSSRLRRLSFDYIIDLQNSRTTQLISFLSFARKTFGFRRKLGFLFNYSAAYKKEELIDPLSSQEKILKLLGVTFSQKKLEFWESQTLKFTGFNLEKSKFIGLSVSASLRRQAKNWPLDNINRFIKLFLKGFPGYNILLIGDEACQSQADRIKNFHKSRKIINLCGKTKVRELIQVLKRLDVFVAPDTATLHLAQSLGVEVIGLFGPTDPRRHTVEAQNLHIIDKGLSCRHCYKNKCQTHECMKNISPKEVFLKTQTILREKETKTNLK